MNYKLALDHIQLYIHVNISLNWNEVAVAIMLLGYQNSESLNNKAWVERTLHSEQNVEVSFEIVEVEIGSEPLTLPVLLPYLNRLQAFPQLEL